MAARNGYVPRSGKAVGREALSQAASPISPATDELGERRMEGRGQGVESIYSTFYSEKGAHLDPTLPRPSGFR